MSRELFEPSLSDRTVEPIYSTTALFWTAFFGGPLAVTLLATGNARRLHRLRGDVPVIALGFIAALLIPFALVHFATGPATDTGVPRNGRLVVRAGALALFGVFYWLHREAHKVRNSMGVEAAQPWGAAILSIVLGAAFTMIVFRIALSTL